MSGCPSRDACPESTGGAESALPLLLFSLSFSHSLSLSVSDVVNLSLDVQFPERDKSAWLVHLGPEGAPCPACWTRAGPPRADLGNLSLPPEPCTQTPPPSLFLRSGWRWGRSLLRAPALSGTRHPPSGPLWQWVGAPEGSCIGTGSPE